jgi:hypothetical protein
MSSGGAQLAPILKRVVPACFVLGAAMEGFMIKTGFYDIVTRKEGERRVQRDQEVTRKRARMRELKMKMESQGDGKL